MHKNDGPQLNFGQSLIRLYVPLFTLCVTACDVRHMIYVTRYLNRRVFFIMLSGCFENCLPWDFALRFAAVVAAYSAGLRALIAASGKYLSPVSLNFSPGDFIQIPQVYLILL